MADKWDQAQSVASRSQWCPRARGTYCVSTLSIPVSTVYGVVRSFPYHFHLPSLLAPYSLYLHSFPLMAVYIYSRLFRYYLPSFVTSPFHVSPTSILSLFLHNTFHCCPTLCTITADLIGSFLPL
ncbi:hypothetical protein B0H19DRAFT_81941 [Mycena capillaripes]|nr:hypothetical protein B0H19DRAFT_81941 [Mycena capillaripes]